MKNLTTIPWNTRIAKAGGRITQSRSKTSKLSQNLKPVSLSIRIAEAAGKMAQSSDDIPDFLDPTEYMTQEELNELVEDLEQRAAEKWIEVDAVSDTQLTLPPTPSV